MSNEDEKKYDKQVRRMVSRWAGAPGKGAPARSEGEVLHRQDIPLPPTIGSVSVQEAPREIPVQASCDVLVVGAGPAGLSAALSARRAGADVMLMERFGCFGGVITTVGMETLAWYRYEGTVDTEGIGIEFERRAAAMGGTIQWPYNDSECLDADFFKLVADELIRESGVRPLLHTYAVEAIVENGVIRGVVTESKSGRQAILARRVIDCTGDADIAHFAGAEYRKTPRDQMMGLTTVFGCAGVERERFLEWADQNQATFADWGRTWDQETTGKEDDLPTPYLEDSFAQARQMGVIPADTKTLGGSWSALSMAGEATNLNLVHLKGYDCTDAEDLTRAEMDGRQQAMHALTALQHTVPGFEKAKLRTFSMTIGCRDSRKIIGRHNLLGEECRSEARFADSIGIFPEFLDGYSVLILPTTGRYFQVPYGCMVPQGVDNLLVAGRCVAGDKLSHAAMRNMMACTVTGQGAGVAAAVSLAREESTRDVNLQALQGELRRQGVRLD
ncbi:MAG: FAD-dependent oxidoreductase [Candidatus Binatia bacterium]|nr:FAD-dependent oxidoreductase [Candidatus Binatia bacterium]MDG2011502.1 FAD-dependent oxidoreductase [Candidatus Binatia bacterium]